MALLLLDMWIHPTAMIECLGSQLWGMYSLWLMVPLHGALGHRNESCY